MLEKMKKIGANISQNTFWSFHFNMHFNHFLRKVSGPHAYGLGGGGGCSPVPSVIFWSGKLIFGGWIHSLVSCVCWKTFGVPVAHLNWLTDLSYNDVKRDAPRPIFDNSQCKKCFYKIYWLANDLPCPVVHRINWFSAFDVIIRKVYCNKPEKYP